MLALPTVAAADHPRTAPEGTIGLEHQRLDAAIWKAQARARERWRKMTRAERRRAHRRERRVTRRAYARASATAGDPSDVGSWAPPFVTATNYKGYAIHAALLNTGKVLMWGQEGATAENRTYAWLWDPAEGYGLDAVRDVTPTDANGDMIPIFCSGMSFLADGRLLVVGGTVARDSDPGYHDWGGLNRAVIFDPETETWVELPRPAGANGRWYPTQVLLADGRTLVVSGFSDDPPGGVFNNGLELYDPAANSFTLLDDPLQQRKTELYPHLIVMPDGTVLLAGPDPSDSAIFDPDNLAHPWTDLPEMAVSRFGGNAVLLPDGPDGSAKVAAIGGMANRVPVASAETIDLDDAAPSWSSFPGLSAPRWNQNTVLLPDGSMVAIGGLGNDGRTDPTPDAERAVELYDPVTGTWQTGASQVETRGYHSTALLLPDGRVLSTGDDKNPYSGMWQVPDDTGEIYSPPYLFKGPRPVISSSPEALRWDVPFYVGTTGRFDDAVLIAPSAVTHANDMTQRLVPLAKVAAHAGGVTLQSPPSANVAPPGWYMLFVLDNGVPSVARWVLLSPTAAAVPASPPSPPDPDDPGSDDPGSSPSGEDSSAPQLEVEYAKRRWLKQLRRGRTMRVQVAVDEHAIVVVRLMRKTERIARTRAELGAGTHRLELTPRRRVIRWLRRTDHPRLRLSVFATDRADNETAWSSRLRR
jgi:hypothetical protein